MLVPYENAFVFHKTFIEWVVRQPSPRLEKGRFIPEKNVENDKDFPPNARDYNSWAMQLAEEAKEQKFDFKVFN